MSKATEDEPSHVQRSKESLKKYIKELNTGWGIPMYCKWAEEDKHKFRDALETSKPGKVIEVAYVPLPPDCQDALDACQQAANAVRRKGIPVATGVIDYFPLALQEIARVSLAGQKQHGIEGKLRWARELSADESDALIRHFIERGTDDTDGLPHTAKMAWRALALLQKELENIE